MTIRSMRGAPPHVRKWWSRTNKQPALFRLVELGASWEEAHERLKISWERWWDRGQRGMDPLSRLSNRVVRDRILRRIEAGETPIHNAGRVAVSGSSFVLPRSN